MKNYELPCLKTMEQEFEKKKKKKSLNFEAEKTGSSEFFLGVWRKFI